MVENEPFSDAQLEFDQSSIISNLPRHTPSNPYWHPHALPDALSLDGRPVWEPPILNYSHLIDTEHGKPYTKRREAVLEYTGGEVAKTTEIMDTFTELQILDDYSGWAISNAFRGTSSTTFFLALEHDLRTERQNVLAEDATLENLLNPNPFAPRNYAFEEKSDGSWELQTQLPESLLQYKTFANIIQRTGADTKSWKAAKLLNFNIESQLSPLPEGCGFNHIINENLQDAVPIDQLSSEHSAIAASASFPPTAATRRKNLYAVQSKQLTTPGLHLRLIPAQTTSSLPTLLAHRPITQHKQNEEDDVD